MTRVLITNDDGIDAPGLTALAEAALAAGLDVTIAAPAAQSSGSSASIMATEADGRITVERRTLAQLPDAQACLSLARVSAPEGEVVVATP